jgi:hypothetical protein
MKNPRRMKPGGFFHQSRRTAGLDYMPQTLPVLHEADELAPNEKEAPPETLEAKVEIFFLTSVLPQLGHFTPSIWLEPNTSSSKLSWHVVHTNSYNGILLPRFLGSIGSSSEGMWTILIVLDAPTSQRLQLKQLILL